MARILFIGIDYYRYVAEIQHVLVRQGHEVDYRPIEPVDFWSKSYKKIAPGAYRAWLDGYHARLIREARNGGYDIVLFIQVHHVSHVNMQELKVTQPRARFILYNWDSLSTHDYRPWLRYFDKVSTFDPVDAEALDVDYQPLFALDDYFALDHDARRQWDLYFVGAIGTFHRFDALASLWRYCQQKQLRVFFHLKCSPVVMIRLLISGRRLPGMSLRALSIADIIGLIERSRCVFDFANHRQSGYTMRLIENMCAGLKVVTENRRIESEEFYRPDRFMVIENLDFSELERFIEQPITSQLDTGPFRIGSWVARLLS
jgi:hypothetical protein